MDTTSKSDVEPELEQPGLSRLRESIANYTGTKLPRRATLLQDALAGLNSAITSVPDGLASGILAGVNPIFGLYAAMAGPIAGGIFSSSPLMIVTTTSASALAAGQALAGLSGEARDNALFFMVLLIGAIQIVLGLLRLGRLTRFVSYSVMTGFLVGIAVLTILSQLPTAAGYAAEGENNIARAIDLLANLDRINLLASGRWRRLQSHPCSRRPSDGTACRLSGMWERFLAVSPVSTCHRCPISHLALSAGRCRWR
jgi:SulP family sulfate permease